MGGKFLISYSMDSVKIGVVDREVVGMCLRVLIFVEEGASVVVVVVVVVEVVVVGVVVEDVVGEAASVVVVEVVLRVSVDTFSKPSSLDRTVVVITCGISSTGKLFGFGVVSSNTDVVSRSGSEKNGSIFFFATIRLTFGGVLIGGDDVVHFVSFDRNFGNALGVIIIILVVIIVVVGV